MRAEGSVDARLEVRSLGPLEVRADGERIPLGGRRQQLVLATLVCARDRSVTTDQLIHAVWGDKAPTSAVGSLQAYLSRLRRLLGGELIRREASGYRLHAASGVVDCDAFEWDLEAADAAQSRGDLEAVTTHCRTALSRWRGQRFLGELGAEAFAVSEAFRLEGLRRQALRMRLDAELELGRHDAVVGELEAALHDDPFDEHLWAQLIVAHHRGGRARDSLAAYRRADRLFRDELGIGPGSRLRDLEVRILRQDPMLGAQVEDDERRSTARHPTNLRASTTSFVGRSDELTAVMTQIARQRVVTVVGTGGVGKTRLAVEAGWQLLADTPGGVWDVDLTPIADPSTTARPLALALQVPYRAGEVGLARLAQRIGDRPTIVLLDNCEHQLGAVGALVRELLSRCPGLRVLATSQEALLIEGESVVELSPLSTEDGTALQLFVDRARAVSPGFQVTAINEDQIQAVLRRVDGLPLAVELAAATLDLLTPRLLAERLGDGIEELQRPGESDPRHATLHATIDWSYELLAEPEQRLLERLAVFAGPIDEAGARAVGTGAPAAAVQVPHALATLTRRSLLAQTAPAADGSPRWRMLEVVRAYGRWRLSARDEFQRVRARHLQHLCDLVTAAAAHLHDDQQLPAVTRLREVGADLDLALSTAAERGDLDRLWSLVEGAWLWWYLDERHHDALIWLDRVAADERVPPRLLAARALVHAVQFEDRHRKQALGCIAEAMTRSLAAEDQAERAYVQLLVGDALTRSPQRFEEAAGFLDAAAVHFARHGPAWAEGWALLRRIRVDGLLHADLDTARTRLARAMERLEVAGDRQLLAYGQTIAANMARLDGTFAEGLTSIGEANRAYADLGYVLPLRESRHLEALLLTELGRLDEAGARWRDQGMEAERTGSSAGRFFATLGQAELLARRGDLRAARATLEQELEAVNDGNDPGAIGPILVVLTPVAGLLARGSQEVAAVRAYGDRLLAAWGDGPVPWHQVRAHVAVAEAALPIADREAAAHHLDAAAALASRIEQPHRLAEVAEARAVLAALRGDHDTVLTLLGGAGRLRADTGAAAWKHVVERSARLQDEARERLGAEAATAAWQRGERGRAGLVLDEGGTRRR